MKDKVVVTISVNSNQFQREALYLQFNHQVHFLQLTKKSKEMIDFDLFLDERGEFKLEPLFIYSEFPFHFVRAWSWVDLKVSGICYPEKLTNEANLFSDNRLLNTSCLDNFDSLSRYQSGDSVNKIFWPIFAKKGELYSKLFSNELDEISIWLTLELFDYEDIEEKLKYLTTYAYLLNSYPDVLFGVELPGISIPLGKGNQHLINVLDHLALYQHDVL